MVPWTQARARPGRSAPLVRFWPVLRIACVQTHRFLVFRNSPSFQARWAFACVRVGARVHVRVKACVRAGVFLPALASRAPALRRALVPPPAACRPRRGRFRSRFSAGGVGAWLPFSSLQAGAGGLGSHRYAGAAPGASSRPAPPVCASAAAVGAHGPAPSLGPCRACLVPFITTLTNPSRA